MSSEHSIGAAVRVARVSTVVALLLLLGVACGTSEPATVTIAEPTVTSPDSTAIAHPTSGAIPEIDPTASTQPALDVSPYVELNPNPEIRRLDLSIDLGFDERDRIPRDAINPVYSPKFVSPHELGAALLPDELVMGLSVDGDARAYPVGIMRIREMVNDVVGGVPLLVTW